MSNTSPPKTGWSRLRNTVRRASTVISSPKPPSISGSDREPDSVSVKSSIKASSFKGIASSLLPSVLTSGPAASTPSPIAESPAREYAATHSGPPVPRATSPLSQPDNVASASQQLGVEANIVAPVLASEPDAIPTSPQDYIPPPVIDSTATGPGGFTDNPDDLPQPQIIDDPFVPPRVATPGQTSVHAGAPSIPSTPPVLSAVINPAPATESGLGLEPAISSNRGFIPPQPATLDTEEEPEPEPIAISFPEMAPTREILSTSSIEQSVQGTRSDLRPQPGDVAFTSRTPPSDMVPTVPATPEPMPYLDNSIADEPQERFSTAPRPAKLSSRGLENIVPVVATVATIHAVSSREDAHPSDSSPSQFGLRQKTEGPSQSGPASSVESGMAPVLSVIPSPDRSASAEAMYPLSIPLAMPGFEMGAEHDVWGSVEDNRHERRLSHSRSEGNGHADVGTSGHSRDIEATYTDPFADPVAPKITVTHPDAESPSAPEPRGRLPSHPVNPSPSEPRRTNDDLYSQRSPVETDERLPLLAHSRSQKNNRLNPPGNVTPYGVTVSPPTGQHVPLASSSRAFQPTVTTTSARLHELGWIEYHLPDGVTYFVHPTRRIITDISLRDVRWLDSVNAYLERYVGTPVPVGMELWIKEGNYTKRGTFVPTNFWVDHGRRVALLDEETRSVDGKKKGAQEDDLLDQEYRYWSFIDSHPAHTALPPNARAEALDVLTWAWTDQLLPSHHNSPCPFTQDECQELTSLVRSFGSEQNDFGLQSVMHTRIIARILLRVVHWRQQLHRPNRPFPTDVGNYLGHQQQHRRPLRAALDVAVICLCLGIPYFFYGRHRPGSRFSVDEEGSTVALRSPGPMLVLGACTCLVAAIVLSASVTFLSLPGLDNYARVASLVAILCASFSVTSTGVAVFRYKADLERPAANVGIEGLMLLSRRSFVMSLPLVFLAYSIIGLVTGVVLYSIRGVTTENPVLTTRPFYEYTKWTAVGALGGLAGILSTSLLL